MEIPEPARSEKSNQITGVQEQKPKLDNLPPEIIGHICSFLRNNDEFYGGLITLENLQKCAQTNRRMYEIIRGLPLTKKTKKQADYEKSPKNWN